MKKIWCKILKDRKILQEYLLVKESIDTENLFEYLQEICYNLKIETPLVLPKHINQLEEYSTTRFSKDDFIDYIDFDFLVLDYFED